MISMQVLGSTVLGLGLDSNVRSVLPPLTTGLLLRCLETRAFRKVFHCLDFPKTDLKQIHTFGLNCQADRRHRLYISSLSECWISGGLARLHGDVPDEATEEAASDLSLKVTCIVHFYYRKKIT